MQLNQKKKIMWTFNDNQEYQDDGEYQGDLKDGKPHGLGRWKTFGSNNTVEGEWK